MSWSTCSKSCRAFGQAVTLAVTRLSALCRLFQRGGCERLGKVAPSPRGAFGSGVAAFPLGDRGDGSALLLGCPSSALTWGESPCGGGGRGGIPVRVIPVPDAWEHDGIRRITSTRSVRARVLGCNENDLLGVVNLGRRHPFLSGRLCVGFSDGRSRGLGSVDTEHVPNGCGLLGAEVCREGLDGRVDGVDLWAGTVDAGLSALCGGGRVP